MALFSGKDFHALHIHFDDTVLDIPQFIGEMPKTTKHQTITVFDASKQCNLNAEGVNSILQLDVGSFEVFSSHCEYDDFPSKIDGSVWIAKSFRKTTDGPYNRLTITKNTTSTVIMPETESWTTRSSRGSNNCSNIEEAEGDTKFGSEPALSEGPVTNAAVPSITISMHD